VTSYCKHELPEGCCADCAEPIAPRHLPPLGFPETSARYQGICAACEGDILPGERIVSNQYDGWMHRDCA
jgi:hypothetical protein